MSPTATPSDATPVARARRTRWAPRWLVVTHRYLGVALGGLMLIWCLSGAVMLFAPYPSLSQDERLARLPRIDWSHCCVIDTAASPDAPVAAAAIEQLGRAPVLRLRRGGEGGRQVIDLSNGHPMAGVDARTATAVAAAWGQPVGVTAVVRDQWTVGEIRRDGPFWRVRLADPARTDIYVSQTSGEAVQRTTRASRTLSWLGAVPHWLYPTLLRQYPKVWAQVVIWTSLAGTFLTLCGLYLGLIAWRPFRDDRLSPFRGLMTWHHLSGLAAGLLTLTWVASGLFSMNPWGFLDSPDDPALARVAGPPPPFAEVQSALQSVQAVAPSVGQVRLAPFAGHAFVIAGGQRFDAQGRPAPLTAADLIAAGARLGAVRAQGPIDREDSYYYAHHEPVTLPAWRVLLADGRRAYLDPQSGAVLAHLDAEAKGYRWLHKALHRLDVVPGYRGGPVWAAATLALLAPVTFGVALGVWLGARRIGHDFAQFRGRLRKTKETSHA